TEAAGGVWIEVCSANGTKLGQVDIRDEAAEEPNSIQADHCPLCLPHFQFRGVPTAATSLPVSPFACRIALCLPDSELILPHNQWRPDRSRARPSISRKISFLTEGGPLGGAVCACRREQIQSGVINAAHSIDDAFAHASKY